MADSHRQRILVMDRDLGELTRLDALLSQEGYLVTLRPSLPEALACVARMGIDLVVAGTGQSECASRELAAKVESLSPGTRVLVLLDEFHSRSYLDMMDPGADRFLSKPYRELQLVDRVKRLLAQDEPPAGGVAPIRAGISGATS